MSQFFTDLFSSIFTPGPTPSIVVATNVSFAGLQLVLLALLIATYSVHFLILSFLSAGLWWAINWFVSELNASQALEDARKQAAGDGHSGDDSDTEAETIIGAKASGSREVEVLPDNSGELKERGGGGSPYGSKSEHSTEDEWEKVSENENEKDK